METKVYKDISLASFFKEIVLKLYCLSNDITSINSTDKPSYASSLALVRKHYSNSVILNELITTVLSSQLSNKQATENFSLIQKFSELDDAFTLLELQPYIHPASQVTPTSLEHKAKEQEIPDEPINLFGINPNHLKIKAKKKISPKHLEVLRNELQCCLLEQCEKIVVFTFPEESYDRTSAGMNLVVSSTLNVKKNLENKRILVVKQKQHNCDLLKLVFQQMMEYEEALENLVKKYRMTSHPLPHLEMVCSSLKAYSMKLRCLQKEILALTYSSSSVRAIKSLKKDLDSKEEEVDRSLAHVEHRLSTYEHLDPKFHVLLKTYSNLQKDLEYFN